MLFRKKYDLTGLTERVFECKRGDLTIRGTEYRPAGENLPIAIVSHGFMANQETTRNYAVDLAHQGYAAYCYDFCGGSVLKNVSDGKTTDMSVLTEVQDLEAVLAYVRSLPYTDESSVLLMGCSQGGFVSALTAAKPENAVSKLVLFYPALCIPDDARAGKMMFAKFDPKNVPELVRCGPMKLGRQYVTDVLELDPYQAIRTYTGPVLIVHGTKDKIVALPYAQRAYETYKAAGADVTLKIIEKGKHGFFRKYAVIANEALMAFTKL